MTLAVNPGGSGSIGASPAPDGDGKYAYGTVVMLTANPASGYSLGTWSGDASGSNNPTTVTMNRDRSVTANFAIGHTFTLRVSHDNWGSVLVEPNLPLYPQGATVTLTAVPNSGKSFAGWTMYDPNHPGDPDYIVPVDPNTLSNPLVLPLTMNSDKEIEADFKCGSGLEQVFSVLPPGLIVLTLVSRRLATEGWYVAYRFSQLAAIARTKPAMQRAKATKMIQAATFVPRPRRSWYWPL